MRAVLILAALLAWASVVTGALGLTVYLSVVAARVVRDRRRGSAASPAPPSRGAVMALLLYAVLMAGVATGLAVLASSDRSDPSAFDPLAWAALPAWSATVAIATAAVLWRRERIEPLSVDGPGRPGGSTG